jgi:hypothetical protein
MIHVEAEFERPDATLFAVGDVEHLMECEYVVNYLDDVPTLDSRGNNFRSINLVASVAGYANLYAFVRGI